MKTRNIIILLSLFSIKVFALSLPPDGITPVSKLDSLQAELLFITQERYSAHEIRDVIREMWKVTPTNPTVLMYHAYYFFRLDKDNKDLAVYFLDRILKQKPDELYANTLKGIILGQHSKYQEADSCFKQALHAPPSDILPIQQWRVNIANAVYQIASKKESKDSVLVYYNLSIRLEPIPRTYAGIASIHEDRGDFEKAIENYTYALELYPEWYECYSDRAYCYRHIGMFDKAIEDYTVCLEEGDNADAYTYMARGNCLLESGNIERAIEDYQIALGMEDEKYQPYVNLAVAYYKLYKPEEAVKYMDKALEKEKIETNYMYRAVMAVAAGQYDKALADFDKVNISDKHYYMTLCHIMLKNKKETIISLHKALECLETEYDKEYDLALHLFKYALKIDWQQSLSRCQKLLSENIILEAFPKEEFYSITYKRCPNRKILMALLIEACQNTRPVQF